VYFPVYRSIPIQREIQQFDKMDDCTPTSHIIKATTDFSTAKSFCDILVEVQVLDNRIAFT